MGRRWIAFLDWGPRSSHGEQITAALTDPVQGQHLQAAVASRDRLLDVGFEAPPWADLQWGTTETE